MKKLTTLIPVLISGVLICVCHLSHSQNLTQPLPSSSESNSISIEQKSKLSYAFRLGLNSEKYRSDRYSRNMLLFIHLGFDVRKYLNKPRNTFLTFGVHQISKGNYYYSLGQGPPSYPGIHYAEIKDNYFVFPLTVGKRLTKGVEFSTGPYFGIKYHSNLDYYATYAFYDYNCNCYYEVEIGPFFDTNRIFDVGLKYALDLRGNILGLQVFLEHGFIEPYHNGYYRNFTMGFNLSYYLKDRH